MNITKNKINFLVKDTTAYQSFWKDDNWEDFTYKCVDGWSNSDKIFIDIGAWIGPISLYASYLNKKCYAIEPDPIAYSELSNNIELNSINNISLHNLAILDKSGDIKLGSEELGNSNTRISANENAFNVKCVTFSDFIESHMINPSDISIIKIDVEGAELEILRDPFFKSNFDIPVHLSVHPDFLKNFHTDIREIFEFTKNYSYIVSNDRYINLNADNMLHYKGFYSIMLYNK